MQPSSSSSSSAAASAASSRAASSASAAPGRRVVSPAAHGFLFSMPVVDDPYYHVYIHIHLEGV